MKDYLHKHQWEVSSTNYFSPKAGIEEMPNNPGEGYEAIMYGITLVTMRCLKCGDIRQERILGHYRSQGIDEVIDTHE